MRRAIAYAAAVLAAAVGVSFWTAGGTAGAAPQDDKNQPKVSIAGFSVARPRPDDKFNRAMAFGMQAGTRVSVHVALPGREIIDLDDDASTLAEFTDDKGTVLAKPGSGGGFRSWLGHFAHVAEDRQSLTPDIHTRELPAKGATRLTLDATLAVVCGADPKTATVQAALSQGMAVKLGSVPTTISDVKVLTHGDRKLLVTFRSSQSFDPIRRLVFVGPDGKEHVAEPAGSTESSAGSRSVHTQSYGLAKKLDKATIKVDYFGAVETVKVPVKLNVTMGL